MTYLLQMAGRFKIAAHRFPPLPFITRRPKLRAADRRVIRIALRGGGASLPTEWPDLEPVLELIDDLDRPLPEGLAPERDRGGAA